MKKLIYVFALALACVVTFARPAHVGARATKFSSEYTDLKTQCKSVTEAEMEGEDTPLRCTGYGGYVINIDFSATSSHITVQPKGHNEDSINLGMQSLNYDTKHKVEWRLADGKPFAVIYRVDNPKDNLDPSEMWRPENKAGESLLVRGLKGYEQIEFEVDAKTPNANEKARQLADAAYSKGR